jgi:AcrR family transcriptional regulator
MGVVTEARAPARGRPRSADADHAILEATFALLEEVGYARMTMQGVAARAGVSTATLYRRWTNKQDLVVATLTSLVPDGGTRIDTGSLARDLHQLLRTMVAKLRSDEGKLIKGIIGEAVRNPALADALRTGIGVRPHPAVVGVIERAVARGEIPPPADVDVASGLIRSYAFERWLLWDEILSEASIDVLVPMLERALGHC